MAKANKDGWIRHRGGKCPVGPGERVEVRFFDGDTHQGISGNYHWQHVGSHVDNRIMAYRIHKPEIKSAPADEPIIRFEEMKKGMTVRFVRFTKVGHEHWKFTPGSEYEVRSKYDRTGPEDQNGAIPSENYGFEFALVKNGEKTEPEAITKAADSVSAPLEWRDRIRQIDAEEDKRNEEHRQAIEALEEERLSLVQKLEGEGFKLIEAKPACDGMPAEDMTDYRNWKVGDIAEVLSTDAFCGGRLSVGDKVPITGIDEDGTITAAPGCWGVPGQEYKFHSRP